MFAACRRLFAGVGLLPAVLLLGGCIPESEQSLSDVHQAVQDPKLHGLWTNTAANGDVQYVHIAAEPDKPHDPSAQAPEPGLMRYWLVTHTAKNRTLGPPLGGRFFITELGDERFGNLVLPLTGDPEEAIKPNTYWFLKFRVSDVALDVYFTDFEASAKAIESGILKGEVVREEGRLKSVRFTDSRANLVRYLREGGSRTLFPEKNKVTYQRLR